MCLDSLGAAPHDLGTSGITCSSVESFLFELLSFQGFFFFFWMMVAEQNDMHDKGF